MSIGNPQLPADDQSNYDAFMGAVDTALSKVNNLNFGNVDREPTDCQKIAALITACQNLWNTYCDI